MLLLFFVEPLQFNGDRKFIPLSQCIQQETGLSLVLPFHILLL